MHTKIKRFAKKWVPAIRRSKVPVHWIKKDSQSSLSRFFADDFVASESTADSAKIEKLAKETNQLGPQPLWSGYQSNNLAGSTRLPKAVRTVATIGNLYSDLVRKLQPNIVAEFGTAFGVSGMYFLAGIELNKKGLLLTFDPNDIWRSIAIGNLAQISDRFESVLGTFEEHIDSTLPKGQKIDLALIDAIHTKEFVIPQLEIVIAQSSENAIIILDDINFSDCMRECWEEVSNDPRFVSSASIGKRVGILELGKSSIQGTTNI